MIRRIREIFGLSDFKSSSGHGQNSDDFKVKAANPSVRKPLLDKKSIVGQANQKITDLRERFKVYKRSVDSNGVVSTRVEREYKKTINFTLIEIQELMTKLRDHDDVQDQQVLKEIKDELDECCTILDSCLNSLEASHNIGHHHREENILCLEFRIFQKGSELPRLETNFIVGTPIEQDYRSRPRSIPAPPIPPVNSIG